MKRLFLLYPCLIWMDFQVQYSTSIHCFSLFNIQCCLILSCLLPLWQSGISTLFTLMPNHHLSSLWAYTTSVSLLSALRPVYTIRSDQQVEQLVCKYLNPRWAHSGFAQYQHEPFANLFVQQDSWLASNRFFFKYYYCRPIIKLKDIMTPVLIARISKMHQDKLI